MGRVCKLTEVVNLQHSDDGETMCMARRRRAAGQGSSWRESQPAPAQICCFASRLSHLLLLLRGVALRCLARKGRRQRTGTGREEPRRAGKVLESGPKPLSTPTDDTIKPDRRSDDRDSPATWPYVRSFWAEEQGQVSSFKDYLRSEKQNRDADQLTSERKKT